MEEHLTPTLTLTLTNPNQVRTGTRVEEHLAQLRLAVSRGALLTHAVATLEARHAHICM